MVELNSLCTKGGDNDNRNCIILEKEKRLITSMAAGDQIAINKVYRTYKADAIRLVVRMGGSRELAEDIYQEAMLNLWHKVSTGKFILRARLSTYMYSVVFRLSMKWFQREKLYSRFLQMKSDHYYGDLSKECEQHELRGIVSKCLNKMGPRSMQVLLLFFFEGLSMAEITERMKLLNTDTAKVYKYLALKQLKSKVKNEYSREDLI